MLNFVAEAGWFYEKMTMESEKEAIRHEIAEHQHRSFRRPCGEWTTACDRRQRALFAISPVKKCSPD
jgi:hypothetical protein